MTNFSPISGEVIRALLDKGPEKRRSAGYEIEKTTKDLVQKDDTAGIDGVLTVFEDFVKSQNNLYRKAGLIGIASVGIGLGGHGIDPYLKRLLDSIYPSFHDQNINVRYYAAEALSNVCRIARFSILGHFNEVFQIIIRLSTEPDQNMRNASEIIDRVVKDIVVECHDFDLVSFVPILREKCMIKGGMEQTKMMLISWILCLQSIPEIDLVPYLPQLLDGVFLLLSSSKPEIRKSAELVMNEFMINVQKECEKVEYTDIINILILHAQSSDPLVQKISLRWVFLFVQLSGRKMVPFTCGILSASMPCLAASDSSFQETKSLSEDINDKLMALVDDNDELLQNESDLDSVLKVLEGHLSSASVACKTVAIKWFHLLNEKISSKMKNYADRVLNPLLGLLCDSEDEIVMLSLQVLTQIASADFAPGEAKVSVNKTGTKGKWKSPGKYFTKFLSALLVFLKKETNVFKTKGSYILRQICVSLPPLHVYMNL